MRLREFSPRPPWYLQFANTPNALHLVPSRKAIFPQKLVVGFLLSVEVLRPGGKGFWQDWSVCFFFHKDHLSGS